MSWQRTIRKMSGSPRSSLDLLNNNVAGSSCHSAAMPIGHLYWDECSRRSPCGGALTSQSFECTPWTIPGRVHCHRVVLYKSRTSPPHPALGLRSLCGPQALVVQKAAALSDRVMNATGARIVFALAARLYGVLLVHGGWGSRTAAMAAGSSRGLSDHYNRYLPRRGSTRGALCRETETSLSERSHGQHQRTHTHTSLGRHPSLIQQGPTRLDCCRHMIRWYANAQQNKQICTVHSHRL